MDDEQTSWRGHSFTLLIFAGVVILCSIFFVLGMVAGRAQRDALVVAPVVPEEPGLEQEDREDLELSFYDAVEEIQPPPLEAPLTSVVDQDVAESADRDPVPPPASVSPPAFEPSEVPSAPFVPSDQSIILQVAALSNAEQAERLREEISARGLPAFVLRPGPDDSSTLYRIRVGPFGDQSEASRVLEELEAAGYEPIISN